MTTTNDQRVAEILARGVARVHALGVAGEATAPDDRVAPQDEREQPSTKTESSSESEVQQ